MASSTTTSSSSVSGSDGERLTQDLINEILLRLPVKSLLGFKSVSKPWLSHISSPGFLKSHLKQSILTTKHNAALILHQLDLSFSLLHLGSAQLVENLNYPYSQADYSFLPQSLLLGSDCGIVCVCVNNETRDNIYLWNPATKHSKLIPPYIVHHDWPGISFGFGFDQAGFDFKLVRIVTGFRGEVHSALYSANRDSWKKIENEHIDNPFHDSDLSLHGFLFWTASEGMMVFDLENEVFVCGIQLPVSFLDVRITDFNDSVAVVVSKYVGFTDKIYCWTLDDEACLRGGGVEASWSMMLSVDVSVPVQSVVGYFNSCDFLLVDEDDDWFLYNSNKEEARNVPVHFGMHEVFKYTESLVSIAGSKQVNWNAHEDYY